MRNEANKHIYYNNKDVVSALIRRIKKNILEHPECIVFKRLPREKLRTRIKQIVGYYRKEGEIIEIDYRFDIIPTLIHEYLHHFHNEWTEKKIEAEERSVVYFLSQRQAKSLIATIGKIL